MNTRLVEENLNLKAKVLEYEESPLTQRLSRGNTGRDQLSNQLQGQSSDETLEGESGEDELNEEDASI